MAIPTELFSFGSGMLEQGLDKIKSNADRQYEMTKLVAPTVISELLKEKEVNKKKNDNINILYSSGLDDKAINALTSIHPELLESDKVVTDAGVYIDSYGGINSERFLNMKSAASNEESDFTSDYEGYRSFLANDLGMGEGTIDIILNQGRAKKEIPQGEVVDQSTIGTSEQAVPVDSSTTTAELPDADEEDKMVSATDVYGNTSMTKFSEHPYYGVFYEVWKNETAAFGGTRTPFLKWMEKEGNDKKTNEQRIKEKFTTPDSSMYSPTFSVAANAEQVKSETANVTSDEASLYIMQIASNLSMGNIEKAQALYEEAVRMGFDSDVLKEMMS